MAHVAGSIPAEITMTKFIAQLLWMAAWQNPWIKNAHYVPSKTTLMAIKTLADIWSE